MLFAGGKFESGLVKPIITTVVGQVDYFNNDVIVPTQNLSKPRWELSGAGLVVRVADQIECAHRRRLAAAISNIAINYIV